MMCVVHYVDLATSRVCTYALMPVKIVGVGEVEGTPVLRLGCAIPQHVSACHAMHFSFLPYSYESRCMRLKPCVRWLLPAGIPG